MAFHVTVPLSIFCRLYTGIMNDQQFLVSQDFLYKQKIIPHVNSSFAQESSFNKEIFWKLG